MEESEQADESRCRLIVLTISNEADGRIVLMIAPVIIGDLFVVTLDMVRGQHSVEMLLLGKILVVVFDARKVVARCEVRADDE